MDRELWPEYVKVGLPFTEVDVMHHAGVKDRRATREWLQRNRKYISEAMRQVGLAVIDARLKDDPIQEVD